MQDSMADEDFAALLLPPDSQRIFNPDELAADAATRTEIGTEKRGSLDIESNRSESPRDPLNHMGKRRSLDNEFNQTPEKISGTQNFSILDDELKRSGSSLLTETGAGTSFDNQWREDPPDGTAVLQNFSSMADPLPVIPINPRIPSLNFTQPATLSRREGWYRCYVNVIIRREYELGSERIRTIPTGTKVLVEEIRGETPMYRITVPVSGWITGRLDGHDGPNINFLHENDTIIEPTKRRNDSNSSSESVQVLSSIDTISLHVSQSSDVSEPSDFEPDALEITTCGIEDCIGRYKEVGSKDGVCKYAKEWKLPHSPHLLYAVEIFRQFSNENHKRYWWMMGRVWDTSSIQNRRLRTTVLYCVKSEASTPPSRGWNMLRDGRKPVPVVRNIKQEALIDVDHFCPTTGAWIVKKLSFFICEDLMWDSGDEIFSMIISFLIDPYKMKGDAQPWATPEEIEDAAYFKENIKVMECTILRLRFSIVEGRTKAAYENLRAAKSEEQVARYKEENAALKEEVRELKLQLEDALNLTTAE